jgi:hypothetical protein
MYKFLLPSYLQSVRTQAEYNYWVCTKAERLRNNDIATKRPLDTIPTHEEYDQEVNRAAVACNGIDPFTGEKLRFDLIDLYDEEKARGDIEYDRQFDLMPVADHIDPKATVLSLEITGMRTNICKSDQTPEEFLAMCRTIVAHGWTWMPGQGQSRPWVLRIPILKSLPIYFPPDFAKGKCTVRQFRKWLKDRTRTLYCRDVELKRPYALNSSWSTYTHMMNDAAQHGQFDPYTGVELTWEEIDTWNPDLARGNREYAKAFALMPTIDHIDPAADVLEFEICSWKINSCKGNLNPQEFVDLCKRVVEYKKVQKGN